MEILVLRANVVHSVELVNQDAEEIEADKVLEVQLAHKVTPERRAMLARKGLQVLLVSVVHRVYEEILVSQDQKVHKVCLAKTVNQDIPDNEESKVSKARQDQLALQVLLVFKEILVKLVLRESQVHLELLEPLVKLVCLAPMVCLVVKVIPVYKDLLVLLVRLDYEDIKEVAVKMDPQAQKDKRERRGQLVYPADKVHLEHKDHLVHRVKLVHLADKVRLVKMVQLVTKEVQVLVVNPVLQVVTVLLDRPVLLAHKVLLVKMVRLVIPENLVVPEKKATRDPKEIKDPRDHLESKAIMVNQGRLEMMVCLVHVAHKVH